MRCGAQLVASGRCIAELVVSGLVLEALGKPIAMNSMQDTSATGSESHHNTGKGPYKPNYCTLEVQI